MRRRKLLVALAGLAVVVVAAWEILLSHRADRATPENLYRVTEGMNRSQVYSILGTPDGFATWRHVRIPDPYWNGDICTIRVQIDADGAVIDKGAEVHNQPNPFANLLARIKRQWHRWFP